MTDVSSTGSEPQRILVVSMYYWPENFRVNDLVEELLSLGHDVTVLTGKPNYPDGEIFPDFRANPANYSRRLGERIHRVPVFPRGKGGWRLMLNYLSFVVTGATLGPLRLRGKPFDAILVFQTSPVTAALPAVVLKWLKRSQLLIWVLDCWPETLEAVGVVRSESGLVLVGQLVRFIYGQCDKILVASQAFAPNVERWSGTPDQIVYFPNWVEPVFEAGIEGIAPAPELAPFVDTFNVMFAGNIGEAQDFPSIIEAADQLRDQPHIKFLIVGDGRRASDVRDEIERRGLQDTFILLGRQPLERMPEFFAGADALLVSLRPHPVLDTTVPGKVQSYMAVGKPILAMLNGEGARVVQEAQGGYVVPAGDSAALQKATRRLVAATGEARTTLGNNARTYLQARFTRTNIHRLSREHLSGPR